MSDDRLTYPGSCLWSPVRRGLLFIVVAEWALASCGLVIALAPDYPGAVFPLWLGALVARAYGLALWRRAPFACAAAYVAWASSLMPIIVGVLVVVVALVGFASDTLIRLTLPFTELMLDAAFFLSLLSAAARYRDGSGRTLAVLGLASLGFMIGPAIALVTAGRDALPVTLVVAGLELVVFTAATVKMRGLVQHGTEGPLKLDQSPTPYA